MRVAFELMGGEPWCFAPEQIGKLTDWQIWELYVKPAVRRQRDATRKGRGRKPPKDRYGGVPSREEFIKGGLHFGLTAEHLGAEFDRWAATEEGQRLVAKRAEIEAREAAEAARTADDFE